MGKLRHVAFRVMDAQRLYEFYRDVFDIEHVRLSPSGSIHVIDGLFNLAFLAVEDGGAGLGRQPLGSTGRRYGIHHYGFAVDDLEEALGRLDDSIERWVPERNGRPTEWSFYDPAGNMGNISSNGFLGREEKRLPGVRLVVIQADDPEMMAKFYENVFYLTRTRTQSDGTIVLSDGDVSLALTKDQTIGCPGIQYVGVQVADWAATQERFRRVGCELPELAEGERDVLVNDPEGNFFAVSPTGWA